MESGACYGAMNEDGFREAAYRVGEKSRSDNVVPGTGSDTDLGYILNANINAANGYVKWGRGIYRDKYLQYLNQEYSPWYVSMILISRRLI